METCPTCLKFAALVAKLAAQCDARGELIRELLRDVGLHVAAKEAEAVAAQLAGVEPVNHWVN